MQEVGWLQAQAWIWCCSLMAGGILACFWLCYSEFMPYRRSFLPMFRTDLLFSVIALAAISFFWFYMTEGSLNIFCFLGFSLGYVWGIRYFALPLKKLSRSRFMQKKQISKKRRRKKLRSATGKRSFLQRKTTVVVFSTLRAGDKWRKNIALRHKKSRQNFDVDAVEENAENIDL